MVPPRSGWKTLLSEKQRRGGAHCWDHRKSVAAARVEIHQRPAVARSQPEGDRVIVPHIRQRDFSPVGAHGSAQKNAQFRQAVRRPSKGFSPPLVLPPGAQDVEKCLRRGDPRGLQPSVRSGSNAPTAALMAGGDFRLG